MDRYAKFGIPEDFETLLPNLKEKTLKWETVYHSGSEINSSSNISFYQPLSDNFYGTIILIPGLATNIDFDPLMKAITYWALTHKYRIINISTFIHDFLSEIKPEKMQNNTYPEFKTIIHQSLKFVQPYIINKPSVLIGHCASSNGIIDTFNECVKKDEKIPVSSTMLFAPWPKRPNDNYKESVYRLKKEYEQQVDTKKLDQISTIKLAHIRFLFAMADFIQETENTKFEPDLMIQWGIPVTFVTAQRDKICPPARIKQYYDILRQKSDNFNYLYLPNKKHSFEKLYEDTNAVISLIRSQRKKTK